MAERVLIIEDDPQITNFLRRGLLYEGYQVEAAADGETGLIAARDRPPDARPERCRRLHRSGWFTTGAHDACRRNPAR